MKKENYRLHTQAVEELVNASKENTPQYSKEELERYLSRRGKRRFPLWLKACLIKAWFFGAVCYFVFWGLSLYVTARLDLYFIAAVILGMVTDLLLNRCLRLAEKVPGAIDPWLMVSRGGAAGFFLNILYACLLLFLVVTVYGGVNMLLFSLGGGLLHVEPLGFGLITLGADLLCLAAKGVLKKIAADARSR